MTIYFQGSELEALWPNPGYGSPNERSGYGEDGWSRAGSQIGGTGTNGWIRGDAGADRKKLWFHDYYERSSSNSNVSGQRALTFRNADLVEGVRLMSDSVGQHLEYWDGSAWIQVGNSFQLFYPVSYDLRIEVGETVEDPDIIEVYVSEIMLAGITDVGLIRPNFESGFRYADRHGIANTSWVTSQMILADRPTLDWKSKTLPPSTLGTDQDGTGLVTDVNEISINNNTFISFDSAGQRASFKAGARTLANEIKGVTAAARARLSDEESPQFAKLYLLIDDVRYYSPIFTLTIGYLNFVYTWNQNPATGLDWIPADVNDPDLEWGWEIFDSVE
jgi:hypothetical protein